MGYKITRKMKKVYYFIFYVLFIFWEKISVPKFFSAFKAGLSLNILEIFAYYSILSSYCIINDVKINFSLENPIIFIPCGVIFILNTIVFDFSNEWKTYNNRFEILPKKIRLFYFSVVWIVIISIIIVFFLLGNSFRKL